MSNVLDNMMEVLQLQGIILCKTENGRLRQITNEGILLNVYININVNLVLVKSNGLTVLETEGLYPPKRCSNSVRLCALLHLKFDLQGSNSGGKKGEFSHPTHLGPDLAEHLSMCSV